MRTLHIGETTGRTLQDLHEANLLAEWFATSTQGKTVPANVTATRAEIAKTGDDVRELEKIGK